MLILIVIFIIFIIFVVIMITYHYDHQFLMKREADLVTKVAGSVQLSSLVIIIFFMIINKVFIIMIINMMTDSS